MSHYFRFISICPGTIKKLSFNIVETRPLTHPLAWPFVTLCCKGRKSQSWKPSLLILPHPPVNRDEFSLTKWFLGKAWLGAMETRQLNCKRTFLFPEYSYFFLLCPQSVPPAMHSIHHCCALLTWISFFSAQEEMEELIFGNYSSNQIKLNLTTTQSNQSGVYWLRVS